MAPIIPPNGVTSTQRKFQSLDKSEEPFETQVDTAGAILGIHLQCEHATDKSTKNCGEQLSGITSDPRPKHTLRWLLKKLQSAEGSPLSPRLSIKAWILLRELLIRTPLAATARLLREHHFTGSLRMTLQWLYDHSHRRQLTDEEEWCLESNSEAAQTVAEELQASKKRKRVDSELASSHVEFSPLTSAEADVFKIYNIRRLHLAVCSVIARLQELVRDLGQRNAYIVEHLKFALRSSQEEAASIFGCSLYITNQILQKSRTILSLEHDIWYELVETAYKKCVDSLVKLWENRSCMPQNLSDETSHRAFRSYCLLPCIQLLTTFRDWARPKNDVAAVRATLEDLVIKHIILPFRDECLEQKGRNKLQAGNVSDFSKDLVNAFKTYRFPGLERETFNNTHNYEAERSASKTRMYLTVAFTSALFDVALRSSPRNTPAERRSEGPWLEKLFTQLTESTSILIPPVSPTQSQRDYVRLVKWMLQESTDHSFRLSVLTLNSILDQTSGLSTGQDEDGDEHTNWDVVSLCLLNDANVFTIPSSSSADRGKDYAYRTPNKYLSSLLSKITKSSLYMLAENDQSYDFKLKEVVIPLCNAFSDARDLTGFLEHWREQMDKLQGLKVQRDSPLRNPSVWEDDVLVQHVARLMEEYLTAGQINHIVSAANSDLCASLANARNDQSDSQASLIILDCVTAGVLEGDRLSRLGESAQSLYNLTERHLTAKPPEASAHRWRLWRIQSALTDHWVTSIDPLVFQRKAQSMINVALELIERVPVWSESAHTVDLTEELHAFIYLLSIATTKVYFWHGSVFSPRQKIEAAIKKFLDVMELFCHRTCHDFFETVKAHGATSQMIDFGTHINSVDALYLKCMTCAIGCPAIIRYLGDSLQSRLIEQAYWCAVFQHRSRGDLANSALDYSAPWNSLLRSEPNALGTHLNKCFRSFRVEHYLKIAYFDDPKFWKMGTADYTLAFDSVQHLSPLKLERGQRSQLTNRILHILLRADPSSPERVRDHLVLLAKLITLPNKSMEILANPFLKGPKQTDVEPTLIQLARIIDGWTKWSTINVQCVDISRKLAGSVMSHLFSNIQQQSSIYYLESLYRYIESQLEFQYNQGKGSTLAFQSLLERVLNWFSQHRNDIPESLKVALASLDVFRQYHLEIILRQIEGIDFNSLEQPEERHCRGVVLGCMVGYADLLMIHPRLHQITTRLSSVFDIRLLKESAEEKSMWLIQQERCDVEYLIANFVRLELALGSYDTVFHPSLAMASDLLVELNSLKHRTERDHVSRDLQKTIQNSELQSKKELFIEFDAIKKTHLSQSDLLLLRLGVSSLQDKEVSEFRSVLSRVFSKLCTTMCSADLFQESIIAMQCMNVFLQKHPRIIIQSNIESLLSGITTKSVRLETRKNEKHSAMLYVGLCRLLTTILVLHRPKIGGRYHALLPALTSLLVCLFTPYTTTSSSAFTNTHGSAFARVLTTLADPTVSSVTRSKKRSRLNLNDETAKAKSITGQHLPYLIMEYCQCRIKKKLSPEMKTALEPGLWAVLNVMTMDGMRTMNAAFNEGERAVWKSLYEDWKRNS